MVKAFTFQSLGLLVLALATGLMGSQSAKADLFPDVKTYDYCDGSQRVPSTGTLRAVTYNIKSGFSSSPEEIAGTLETLTPDIVYLQEVEIDTVRVKFRDIAAVIASRLKLCGGFYASLNYGLFGRFGNVILSRYPLAHFEGVKLPYPSFAAVKEQRSVAYARLQSADGTSLHFLTTHLSLSDKDQAIEAQFIRSRFADLDPGNVLLGGDFNARPDSSPLQTFAKTFPTDPIASSLAFEPASTSLKVAPPLTFPSYSPEAAIDHFMVHGTIVAKDLRAIPSQASDHTPLFLEFTH